MLQLRATIDGELKYLDLFPDEDVTLDYSFAEIQDLTAKNSSYTRSFTIPGSKNNNDIFQHFYDFNSSMTDYDIRDTFEASLCNDGYELFRGYIRLENVTIDITNITYTVTFYAQVGKLSSAVGDKLLADLDFTSLEFPYTPTNIENSLYDFDFLDESLITQPYQKEVTFMLAQYGYDYDDQKNIISGSTPILDYRNSTTPGYFDYVGTPLRFYYLKPAVQVKWLYKQIFEEAGFRIQSDFFDTAYWDRFYLPMTFNSDSLYLNQAVRPVFEFLDDSRVTPGQIVTSAFTWTELADDGSIDYTQAQYRGRQFPVIEDNIFAGSYSFYAFKVPTPGNYTIKVTWGGYNTKLFRDVPNVDQPAIVNLYFHQIESGGVDGITGNTLFEEGFLIPAGASALQSYTFNAYLTDTFSYTFDANLNGSIYPAIWNYYEMEIVDGPRTIIGDIKLERELPDQEVKQIDFIQGINRRFNLVVVPDPEFKDVLRVEPVVDYVGKGAVLDWSQKLDENSAVNIQTTTAIINGTLYFTGLEDQDYGNVEYTKTTNNIYGSRYVNLSTNYKSTDTIFNDGFTNPVDDLLLNVGRPNITIPIYYITREENDEGTPVLFYNARKTLPRIVFRGLNLPAKNVGYSTVISGGTVLYTTQNNFYLENTQVDMFPLYNRFTTYPFGVTGLTHAVTYNKFQKFNQEEYDFSCYEDLYDVYYKDYIEDLTDPDNRVLSAFFYLLPEEVSNLQGNERIFIKGNYYRINQISAYKLNEPSLVEVELIKLTQDYNPHRVRYYKLTNCIEPTDILYGNTDLNFTLYAYLGGNISVDGKCYQISNDYYRDNVTYQRFTTTFQTNSFLPQIYTDCSCGIPFDEIDIYDELGCSVPVPIPTPTPIGTTYYYVLEKCEAQQQILAASTTFYPLGQVVRTLNGGTTCYFISNYTSTVNTNFITYTYSGCSNCASNIPTPTPTRTPSPTPTITPSGCNCIEFEVYNDLPVFTDVEFTDCYGNHITDGISVGAYYYDCGCQGTIETGGQLTILGACGALPTPTPTPTKTKTPTPTPSITPTKTPSPTPTTSVGITKTPTQTPSKTPTSTPTYTPTKTSTPTITPSITPTNTITPTKTKTPTPTSTPCTCNEYLIENTSAQVDSITYYTCSTKVRSNISVNPFDVVTICSCGVPTGSFSDISLLGPC